MNACPQCGKTCKRVERASNFIHCPWCDYLVETTNPVQFCSGCYCNYWVGRDYVHFDKDYVPPNNDALQIAKVFARAGGMRFGKEVDAKPSTT